MRINEAIRKARKLSKYNQDDFSKLIGVTKNYLSRLETGDRSPSLSLLEKISDNSEIPLPVLFFLSLSEEDFPEDKLDVYDTAIEILHGFVKRIWEYNGETE